MIAIKHDVSVTIDGEDVKTLSDTCELARLAIRDGLYQVLDVDVSKVSKFSREIWEKT